MKKLVFLLAIMLVMVGSTSFADEPQRVIAVSGVGEVTAVPDQASVGFSVDTVNMDAQKAVSENNAIVSKFKEELIKMGISEKEIKTTSYNFFKDYDYSSEREERKFIGYRLINSFDVKVKEIDKVAAVLNKAVENGITGMDGVDFSVSNEKALYSEALKLAVEDAGQKAKTIAGSLNVAVKSPARIVESSMGGYDNRLYMEKSSVMNAAGSISQGELKITANISAEYTY